VLTAHDGGSEHCQEDNRQVGAHLVAGWLAERLGGRLCQPQKTAVNRQS